MYDNCADDYSIECNINTIINRGGKNETNEDLIKYAFYTKYPFGQISINKVSFPWWKSFESGYCASFNSPPSNCVYCSDECPYEVQSLKKCFPKCNTTSCGYSNMHCLEVEGNNCYSFMINDGNCNFGCENDSDCDTDSQYTNTEIIMLSIFIPCGILWLCSITIIFVLIIKNNYNKKKADIEKRKQLKNLTKETAFKEKICILDLKEIEDHDLSVITPCNHIFHRECFKEWLKNENNSIEKNCPVCKSILVNFKF
ncbi:hypothetical protein SteCoe_25825 [Stentor coeruleus]|uniref:RING-type domain-containing protein n=1 Tax=Stentor coeruleus TaxID=5963 RepID=A0A1R2BEF4_9CILI|nr:hypothetical protein SteCoe_25825 [Stentor coeruleus]